MRHVLRTGFGIVLAAATAAAPQASEPAAVSALVGAWSDGGSSSREARRQAIDRLPLERMAKPARQAVEKTLRSTTLYRRLPAQSFTCSPTLLEFALTHPEAIVDVWRVLGISRLALDPTGPAQWRLADGYGTVGVMRLVHHERQGRGGTFVFHGRGGYAGALAPRPLAGSCLLLVRHRPEPPAGDGRDRQTVEIDAFLDVDGMGLELVARTLQPIIVRSAASNLEEVCIFMEALAAAAERNPAGVERLTERLTRTDPENRATFAGIVRAMGRDTRHAADPEAVQTELAARWLPADDLDSLQ